MLAALHEVVDAATRSFDDYDYARALEQTERFFWGFCDDYLELVKQRAYGSLGDDGAKSARTALTVALVHAAAAVRAAPAVRDRRSVVVVAGGFGAPRRVADGGGARRSAADDTSVYTVAAAVLSEIRKAKSNAKRSMRTEVVRATVHVPADLSQALELAVDDLREAGRVDRRPRHRAGRRAQGRRRARRARRDAGPEVATAVELARSPGLARRPRRPVRPLVGRARRAAPRAGWPRRPSPAWRR